MKKLSVLLAFIVLVCSLSLSVFAEGETLATITGATANAGEEITLTVSVKNSPAIAGAQFFIGYDSNVMSFVSATALDSSFTTTFSEVEGANPVKITMVNFGLVEKSGDITVATVNFKLANDVKAGNYTVTLSVPEAYNAKITPIRIPAENAVISVGTSDHEHTFAEEKGTKTVSAPEYTIYTCECGHSFTGNYPFIATEVKMTINSLVAYINGEERTLDAAPIIRNSRTMLPVRFLANSLGISDDCIKWDDATKTATLQSEETTIVITIGAPAMTVNEKKVALDSPALIENSRTYLPLRAIANALGVSDNNISWDDTTKTATLIK